MEDIKIYRVQLEIYEYHTRELFMHADELYLNNFESAEKMYKRCLSACKECELKGGYYGKCQLFVPCIDRDNQIQPYPAKRLKPGENGLEYIEHYKFD